MATVSRTALTSSMLVILLLPMTLVVLLQGPPAPSAHAFPLDDFGDSIRLTFDPAVSTNISSTVDERGDIHVVWEDYRTGNGDIYYFKLDAEGNKLTNDAMITNDTTASRNPAIAVDSGGQVYIVWENIDNGSSELLFAKLWYYEGNITFQVNGLQVSDSDPANSMEPDIAVCSDGNLALVWTDARHDSGNGNLEIYYKRLRPSGMSLTADTRITGDVGRSEHPKLDIGPDGMVHIVWYDFRDSNDGLVINHGVFHRKVHPDGTPLTNETRITFASPQSRPDVAVDTNGNVHIVFDDDRYASFDIFYTLLDSDGNTLVDDRNISPKDDFESRRPTVALSDSNAVDVVWQDQASGAWTVRYSAMNYAGEIEVYDQALTSEAVGNATLPLAMCAKDNNTLVLYIGDRPNMEVFYSRTHRPDLTILQNDVSLSAAQPLVGTTLWVNVTVRNLEGDTVAGPVVRFALGSLAVEDAVMAPLASGASATVVFSHTVSEGDSSVTVTVDPDNAIRETDEGNNQRSAPILVRVPGMTFEADANSRAAIPGEIVTFNLTVTNEGNAGFWFELANSSLEDGWTLDLGGSPYARYLVPSGSSVVAGVRVGVPDDVLEGPRPFTVAAWCIERPSLNASVDLMVDVVRYGRLTVVAPTGGLVEPTVPVTYTFRVSNSANSNETFVLSALDSRGWDMYLSHYRLELAPGERVEVSLTAIPARYDPPGTLNTVTLWVGSEDLEDNVGSGNVLCIVGHHREVDVRLSQQELVNVSVPRDMEVLYTLIVTNLGNSDDVFELGLIGVGQLWAVLNTSYLFMGPGEEQQVSLRILTSYGVLAGQHSFDVSATSENDPAVNRTLTLYVNVLPFYDLRVSADVASLTLRKGDIGYVNMTVENMGNAPDAFDIYAYVGLLNGTTAVIDGRSVNLETGDAAPITLVPGGSATIPVTIPVTPWAELGENLVYFDMSSLNDPSVMASLVVTVVVEKGESWLSLWVVLAVVVAVVLIALFLVLRRRQEEAAAEEEERRRMQARKRPPGPPRSRPKAP